MIRQTLFLLSATSLFAMFASGPIAAGAPPMPATSTVAHQNRGAWPQPIPFGATVLYDQSGIESTNVIAEDFTDFPAFAAQVADDFVVTDASNWTVLSIAVQENTTQATNLPATLFNVSIFADAAGAPGTDALCDYANLAATFDATQTVATIPLLPLTQSCVLPPGTYWLTATPVIDFASGGYLFASLGDTGAALGAIPVWQNPGGAYGGHCPTWTPLTTCADLAGYSATVQTLFQIIGHTGGQPGRIDVTIGLAEYNGDPTQCGTANDFAATVGDTVNACYTLVNNSPITLNYQSLKDNLRGTYFTDAPITVEPGASYQFNSIFTAATSQSPLATWTSSDVQRGYDFSAGTYDFIDISTTGTALDLGDDAGADVTMPFSFELLGTTSDQVCINNNGIMLFGTSGGCQGLYANQNLPSPFVAGSGLMPFWDDLGVEGNVFYQTVGAAPNRQFVAEWFEKDALGGSTTPGYTFELILNEADGSIDFNYANVADGGSAGHDAGLSATVGLQFDGGYYSQFSSNVAVLTDGENVHWTLRPPPIAFSTTARYTLDVGAPTITVLPVPIVDTAVAGTSIETPLYLVNTGNRDLDWSVLSAPSSARSPRFDFAKPDYARFSTDAGLPPLARRAGPSPSRGRVAFGTDAVPAFGVVFTSTGNQFVDFDAAAPGALNEVAPVTSTYLAGTFANFDFTTEYVVDSATGGLYSMSTSDGTQVLIGPTGVPSGETVTAIAWDATSGAAYLMTAACTDDLGSDFSTLYTLDLATAETTVVGTLTSACNVAMAIDPTSGRMYTIDLVGGFVDQIDKSSGGLSGITFLDITVMGPQALAYDASNEQLYLAAFDGTSATMYALNPDSGTTSSIGAIGSGAPMGAFAIATLTPPCQRPGEIPWLSQSATDGTLAPTLYTSVDLTLDASLLTEGTYSATLCVRSNDPQHPLTVVPVSFAVTGGVTTDSIFVDGFDGS